jgi:hypothetical protein
VVSMAEGCAMTCSTCGKPPEHGDVFLSHSLQWGKRRFVWTLCSKCEREEMGCSAHPRSGVKGGV